MRGHDDVRRCEKSDRVGMREWECHDGSDGSTYATPQRGCLRVRRQGGKIEMTGTTANMYMSATQPAKQFHHPTCLFVCEHMSI